MVRNHEETTITLGGETFAFRTPKMAMIISAMMRMKGKPEQEQIMIMIEAQARWIRSGVGADVWQRIESRLNDDDDELDWPDLSAVYQAKVGQSAGRPTTSSPASSQPSRVTTSSGEKPSQPESIFGD